MNKYPGYCVTCGKQVGSGHGELTRSSSGAWVVQCGRSKSSSAKGSSRSDRGARRAGETEKRDGVEVILTPRLGERDAAALLGATFRAGPRCGPVASQVVTVVGAETYFQSEEDNEDMGDMQGGGWGATRWVRLATPEEAAPVLAREAERDAAAARAKRVEAIARDVLARGRREEAEAEALRFDLDGPDVWNWDRRAGTVGGVLLVEGDRVTSWDSGYYDDYRRAMGVVEDAALAAEVRQLMPKKEPKP